MNGDHANGTAIAAASKVPWIGLLVNLMGWRLRRSILELTRGEYRRYRSALGWRSSRPDGILPVSDHEPTEHLNRRDSNTR